MAVFHSVSAFCNAGFDIVDDGVLYNSLSSYTKETLAELESVGMLALVECARGGGYDRAKGSFTTYLVSFLDGAMRRHLEVSMGSLSGPGQHGPGAEDPDALSPGWKGPGGDRRAAGPPPEKGGQIGGLSHPFSLCL